MEISAIKNQLRKQYKQLREQLTIEQVKKNSAQIADRLFQTSFWQNSSTVMLYLSFQNEVMTDQIYQQGWMEGKTMLMPICSTQDGIMIMSKVTSFAQLDQNRYGIRELPETLQQIVAPETIDLCLITGTVDVSAFFIFSRDSSRCIFSIHGSPADTADNCSCIAACDDACIFLTFSAQHTCFHRQVLYRTI